MPKGFKMKKSFCFLHRISIFVNNIIQAYVHCVMVYSIENRIINYRTEEYNSIEKYFTVVHIEFKIQNYF